ncbi:SLC18A2 [Branchiostoma lanceolatum]|uniref:SLC18A2 protein n=1 Tax=Branchiostoma lanceolatum TaxID=7740 RepID=A0A8J9YZA9_BRALA|nr:SLC18A2 [Branchiostoma lanceolatum]
MLQKAMCTFNHLRTSRTLVVIVACLAVFLDEILNSAIEPIMQDYLYRLEHPNYSGAIITHRHMYIETVTSTLSGNVQTSDSSCKEETTCPPAVNTRSNSQRADQLERQSVKLGILYASSPAAAIITNPIAGLLADRLGCCLIMYVGMILAFFSTTAFAFSTSCPSLFTCLVVQGVGGSLSAVAAYIMLAKTFTVNTERASTIALVHSGLTVGSLVGPVIGGVMYHFIGFKSPFLLIAGLTFVNGALSLLLPRTSEAASEEEEEDYSIFNYLKDPYVMINAVIIFVETTTTLMVLASSWQQGVALVPIGVGYIIGTFLSSTLMKKAGSWLLTFVGSIGSEVFTTIIPLCSDIPELVAPYLTLGIASGLIQTSVVTDIGHLADIRHGSRYGSAFAISVTAKDVGTVLGLGIGGVFLNAVGFFPDDVGRWDIQHPSQSGCHPSEESSKYRKEGRDDNSIQGGEPPEDAVLQTSTWGGSLRHSWT